MQHEEDFDRTHPQGEVKTLDQIAREAAERDRAAPTINLGVMPDQHTSPTGIVITRLKNKALAMLGLSKPKKDDFKV